MKLDNEATKMKKPSPRKIQPTNKWLRDTMKSVVLGVCPTEHRWETNGAKVSKLWESHRTKAIYELDDN